MPLETDQYPISHPIIILQNCMVTDFIFAGFCPLRHEQISATAVTNLMITHVNFGTRIQSSKTFFKINCFKF